MSRRMLNTGGRARKALSFVAVALLTVGVVSSAADAFSFTPARTVGKAGESRGFPRVAVDSAGTRTVVWHNYERAKGRIQAVRIDAAGKVGTVRTLSGNAYDSNNPEIGIDSAGRATIVWDTIKDGESLVQWTRLDANGTQGPVKNLPGTASDVEVDVNPDGEAAVAWTGEDLRLKAAVIQTDGTVGTVQTLDESIDSTQGDHKQVTIDDAGSATVMWEAVRRNPAIHMAKLDAGGTLIKPRTLSDPGKPAYIGSIATDASGVSFVVWTIRPGQVKMMRVASDGTFSRVRTISGPGFNRPFVVIDDQRRATVVWSVEGKELRWVRVAPSGKPGKRGSRKNASVDNLAVDGSGRVWVAWNQAHYRKRSGDYRGSIKVLSLAANGTTSKTKTLSGPREDTYDFQQEIVPDVASSRSGKAGVVWTDASKRNARIRWSSLTR